MAPVAAGDLAGAALQRALGYRRRGKRFGGSPGARRTGRRELRRPDGDAMDAGSDGRSRRRRGSGSEMHGSPRRVPSAPEDHHEASGVDREGRESLDEEIDGGGTAVASVAQERGREGDRERRR
jgi:hypothetical protein